MALSDPKARFPLSDHDAEFEEGRQRLLRTKLTDDQRAQVNHLGLVYQTSAEIRESLRGEAIKAAGQIVTLRDRLGIARAERDILAKEVRDLKTFIERTQRALEEAKVTLMAHTASVEKADSLAKGEIPEEVRA